MQKTLLFAVIPFLFYALLDHDFSILILDFTHTLCQLSDLKTNFNKNIKFTDFKTPNVVLGPSAGNKLLVPIPLIYQKKICILKPIFSACPTAKKDFTIKSPKLFPAKDHELNFLQFKIQHVLFVECKLKLLLHVYCLVFRLIHNVDKMHRTYDH